MSNLASNLACCDTTCTESTTVQVPGPQGPAGTNGTNGTNGNNAYTLTTSSFTMPAEQANVTIAVAVSAWAAVGQVIYISAGGSVGYFQVVTVPTSTSIQVKNLANTATGAYPTNSAPATVFASSAAVTPGGVQGPAGTAAVGAFAIANNLSEGIAATMRTNLGLGSLAVLNTVNGGNWSGTDLAVADGGTGASTAANARTNLGLVIGTDVQAQNANLQSISALGTAAAKMIRTSGINTWIEVDAGGIGLDVLAATTGLAVRNDIGGVKRGYGILAYKLTLDLNTAATDTAIAVEALGRYRIDKIVVVAPSINMTTATLGVFTAAGGGGTTIAADQSLAALSATTKFKDLTLQAIVTTDIFTALTLYLRVGTPQGAAATADVYLFGEDFTATA